MPNDYSLIWHTYVKNVADLIKNYKAINTLNPIICHV